MEARSAPSNLAAHHAAIPRSVHLGTRIAHALAVGVVTHHSNMDVYDHLVGEDLKQAATAIAGSVYSTAERDEMPRRKGLKPAASAGPIDKKRLVPA